MSNLRDLPYPSICHRDLMLATPAKVPFSKKGWIYELKHDGFRCLTAKCGDVVRLESRQGNDMAHRFPELVDELRAIGPDIVVDAELVVLDNMGRPVWERLKVRHAQRNAQRIRAAAAKEPAVIFAFDLLWFDGKDMRARPLLERKAALHDVLPRNGRVRYAGHFADSCAEVWTFAKEMELEGIVAKDGTSVYSPGRTTSWLKTKTAIGAERERKRRPA